MAKKAAKTAVAQTIAAAVDPKVQQMEMEMLRSRLSQATATVNNYQSQLESIQTLIKTTRQDQMDAIEYLRTENDNLKLTNAGSLQTATELQSQMNSQNVEFLKTLETTTNTHKETVHQLQIKTNDLGAELTGLQEFRNEKSNASNTDGQLRTRIKELQSKLQESHISHERQWLDLKKKVKFEMSDKIADLAVTLTKASERTARLNATQSAANSLALQEHAHQLTYQLDHALKLNRNLVAENKILRDENEVLKLAQLARHRLNDKYSEKIETV